MASQPVEPNSFYVEISSFIRGYHAYLDVWQPSEGEVLLLHREPTNVKDNQAVSVMKNALVVGHVPYNFAALFSRFLSRTCNKGVAELGLR